MSAFSVAVGFGVGVLAGYLWCLTRVSHVVHRRLDDNTVDLFDELLEHLIGQPVLWIIDRKIDRDRRST
jgi:hypothetical protein